MRRAAAAAAFAVVFTAALACSDPADPTGLSRSPGAASFVQGGTAKMTICHAAGRAGDPKYIAITVSVNAASGHLLPNGTPKAGHELDYLVTESHACGGPPAAQLVICNSQDQGTNDGSSFPFTASDGSHSLLLNSCTDVLDVVPGDQTVVEEALPIPAVGAYFVTKVDASPAADLLSASIGAPRTGATSTAYLHLNSGVTTTVTFWNRN